MEYKICGVRDFMRIMMSACKKEIQCLLSSINLDFIVVLNPVYQYLNGLKYCLVFFLENKFTVFNFKRFKKNA